MKNYVMVIDEGTTGTRSLIFDKKFNIVASVYEEFTQYTPAENMVEHDAVEIYEKSMRMCNDAIKKANIDADEIVCIGITNQRNTCLIWDKATGIPLYPAIVWQDTRTAAVCEEIKKTPFFNELLETTGKIIAPYCCAPLLKWLIDNVPGVEEKLESGEAIFGTIDTWLVWKMTEGKIHATSFSNASSTGCLDIHKGIWYQKLFDHFEVPISVFPKVLSESSDYGVTQLFGSPIPITGVVADQQSALFAEECRSEGSVKCTNGTGSFMDINIGKNCTVVGGGLDTLIAWQLDSRTTYALEGMVSVTGSAVQWLRDGLEAISSSSETEEMANSVPDTNGVFFVPAFVGLSAPYQDPFARGTILGINRGTKKAHIVRATLEAIAFCLTDVMKSVYNETGVKINQIKIDGGASNNNLLAQMMADYIDCEVVRPKSVEATSLGAAEFAGLYAKFWTQDDIKNILPIDKSFSPVMKSDLRDANYKTWTKAISRAMHWLD